jgi:hypothetical protein
VSSRDYYHDDPVFDELGRPRSFSKAKLLVGLTLIAGFFLQSTLAANINLTSSTPLEFGQGVQLTTACSGETELTVTPNVQFTNVSGAGSYYFNSVTVSNIPVQCYGVDFTINAYGATSNTPLSIFNSTSKSAVIFNNAGSFEIGVGGTGTSVSSSPGTFTVNFTNPVALSSSVFRVTIQSGKHTLSCLDGGICVIGDIGPGGGRVFYVASSSGFVCGATMTDRCNYLEAAPPALGLASFDNDATFTTARTWAQSSNQSTSVPTISDSVTATAIGRGYNNTLAIIAQGNSNPATSAAALAQSYSGGGKNDWHLPSKDEMQQLCNWSINSGCFPSGRTMNSGVGAAGFVDNGYYWTSSQLTATTASGPRFGQGGFQSTQSQLKSLSAFVRPIRAF